MVRLASPLIPRAAAAAVLVALALAAPGRSQSGGPPGRWSAKAKLPTAMAEVGVAALGGKIYVLGGTAQGRFNSPLNEEYDPATDSWRERAPLPKGSSHVGAAALDGKLYSIGGFTNVVHVGAQDIAFAYDPASDHLAQPAAALDPARLGRGGGGRRQAAHHRRARPRQGDGRDARGL